MAELLPKCELCGEPMPAGEEMFKFHGYSRDCPKPPLPKDQAVVGFTEIYADGVTPGRPAQMRRIVGRFGRFEVQTDGRWYEADLVSDARILAAAELIRRESDRNTRATKEGT